jgi:hypothetical protein
MGQPRPKEAHAHGHGAGATTTAEIEGTGGKSASVWQRRPREERLTVALAGDETPRVQDVPDSGGLQLQVAERPIETDELGERFPRGTRSVSVFLVNRRTPHPDNPDLAYAFQAEIEVQGDRPFVPRSDPRGAFAEDWDEQGPISTTPTRRSLRPGTGSAEWEIATAATPDRLDPEREVEKTATVDIPGVERTMESFVPCDGGAAEAALRPLAVQYREWIEAEAAKTAALGSAPRETARELLRLAGITADRIERGDIGPCRPLPRTPRCDI